MMHAFFLICEYSDKFFCAQQQKTRERVESRNWNPLSLSIVNLPDHVTHVSFSCHSHVYIVNLVKILKGSKETLSAECHEIFVWNLAFVSKFSREVQYVITIVVLFQK